MTIKITDTGRTKEFVSYTRYVGFEYEGKEYHITLTYDELEGYDYDGVLPNIGHGDRIKLLEELDFLTCDKPECYGCQTRKVQ